MDCKHLNFIELIYDMAQLQAFVMVIGYNRIISLAA
jgi:hypothetical protein